MVFLHEHNTDVISFHYIKIYKAKRKKEKEIKDSKKDNCSTFKSDKTLTLLLL